MVNTASLSKKLKAWYESLGGSLKIEHKKVFEKILGDLAKGETVAVGSLETDDIEAMFGLKRDPSEDIWKLPEDSLEEVPSSVVASLDRISRLMLADPKNEASCRMRIDAMLLQCLDSEQDRAKENNQWTLSPMAFAPETHLELAMTRCGKKKLVTGKADYTLWYHDQSSIGTNLIVVEAKKVGSYSTRVAQCLGYMGMVHTIRKHEGKKNCTVYGCTTDSYHFVFLRIDNNGRYSEWTSQRWENAVGAAERETWTHLCRILREAIAASPRCALKSGPRPPILPEARKGWRVQLSSSAEQDEDGDEINFDLPELDFGPPWDEVAEASRSAKRKR